MSIKQRLRQFLPALASIAVGVLPVVVLIVWFGVPRKLIIGWGVLSYVIGVAIIKMPLYHVVVVRFLHGKLSHLWLSVSQGLLSAFAELGAAYAFFVLVVPTLNLPQLIGFGAAAGAVEAIVLPFIQNPFKGTPLEEHASQVSGKSAGSQAIDWMSVIERALAIVVHVASRGLVYLSFSTGNLIPALVAVLTFASIDGRAYYAHLEKWPFDQVKTLWKFYRYLALVAFVQVACFSAFYAMASRID